LLEMSELLGYRALGEEQRCSRLGYMLGFRHGHE